MNKILSLMLVMLPLLSFSQSEKASRYSETITIEDLKDDLSILASDALEGRETGERGQKMAAAFIKAHFEEIGLKAPVPRGEGMSYYQDVPLYTLVQKGVSVGVNDVQFKNFEDIIYYGQFDTEGDKTAEIIYAGPGTEEIYKDIDVKGHAVLVKPPKDKNWRAAMSAAMNAGAELVFVVSGETHEDFQKLAEQFRPYIEGGRLSLEKPSTESKGVFFVSPQFATKVLGVKAEELDKINEAAGSGNLKQLKKIKPVEISYNIDMDTEQMISENVMGYLEGSDLKEELVVLTAHYDHVGMEGEEIYNGADDDGSGTSAVLEIAEAFVKAKENGDGPRRSMLFMLVTGEEKGLLGSEYYAANPVFPLENTIVDLNIDMIGRVDEKHKDNPDYVYLVGADRLSSELHELSEKTNATYTNLALDYTYNDEAHPDRIYYRSDHWNFAKNNIPIIFYFNGVHEDYHKPTDEIEKIEWEVLKKRTDLVFYTAWELSNRDKRLVVDKATEEGDSK